MVAGANKEGGKRSGGIGHGSYPMPFSLAGEQKTTKLAELPIGSAIDRINLLMREVHATTKNRDPFIFLQRLARRVGPKVNHEVASNIGDEILHAKDIESEKRARLALATLYASTITGVVTKEANAYPGMATEFAADGFTAAYQISPSDIAYLQIPGEAARVIYNLALRACRKVIISDSPDIDKLREQEDRTQDPLADIEDGIVKHTAIKNGFRRMSDRQRNLLTMRFGVDPRFPNGLSNEELAKQERKDEGSDQPPVSKQRIGGIVDEAKTILRKAVNQAQGE